MKPDLVSLRNAWRYKQYGKTEVEVAGKSYGKTERMKTKSMVSVLYSKQPSWEMTAEYLNYSLPTKEKDETFQSIAAFLEGFSYISNANENLNVHAKDLRIFLPEKEEKEAEEEERLISEEGAASVGALEKGTVLPQPFGCMHLFACGRGGGRRCKGEAHRGSVEASAAELLQAVL